MDAASESGGGLSKLLPKAIAAKRRRRKQEAREDDAAAATAAMLRDSGSYVHDTDNFSNKDSSTGFPDYDYDHYREHGHEAGGDTSTEATSMVTLDESEVEQ
ncbi:GRAM domain-containing protein [Colletotrichum tofieldiae]|nr:GRAM domain-containing protein [Colletotrichum tofieldiae]